MSELDTDEEKKKMEEKEEKEEEHDVNVNHLLSCLENIKITIYSSKFWSTCSKEKSAPSFDMTFVSSHSGFFS